MAFANTLFIQADTTCCHKRTSASNPLRRARPKHLVVRVRQLLTSAARRTGIRLIQSTNWPAARRSRVDANEAGCTPAGVGAGGAVNANACGRGAVTVGNFTGEDQATQTGRATRLRGAARIAWLRAHASGVSLQGNRARQLAVAASTRGALCVGCAVASANTNTAGLEALRSGRALARAGAQFAGLLCARGHARRCCFARSQTRQRASLIGSASGCCGWCTRVCSSIGGQGLSRSGVTWVKRIVAHLLQRQAPQT